MGLRSRSDDRYPVALTRLEEDLALFREFADLDEFSNDGILKFANTNGWLGLPEYSPGPPPDGMEGPRAKFPPRLAHRMDIDVDGPSMTIDVDGHRP